MVMKRFLLSVLALVLLVVCGVFFSLSKPYYIGATSDHFKDGEFYNFFYESQEKTISRFIRWRFLEDREEWPDYVANLSYDRPPRGVYGNQLRVSFVNHATVLLQIRGLNILTDPIWSERASPFSFVGPKRVRKPGIRFEDLPPIDIVLISHNHYEHLDLPTIQRLWDRDRPHIFTFLGNDTIIKDYNSSIAVTAMDWYDEIVLDQGLVLHGWPAQHWSSRWIIDRNKALWGGFVIESPSGNIFFAGDTGYGKGYPFKKAQHKFGTFRLALLPYGSYEPYWFMKDGHMNPEDAVRAYEDLNAEYALGIHHGTFQLTNEEYDKPDEDLQAARVRKYIDRTRFRVLENGAYFFVP